MNFGSKFSIFLLPFALLLFLTSTASSSSDSTPPHNASLIQLPCLFETTFSYGFACFVSRLFISTRDKIIEKFTSVKSRPLSSPDSVRYLKIEESLVLYLPIGLGGLFPKLETFRMEHQKLREIHQKDLELMTNLERIYLEGNDIQVLEKDLFKFNLKLKLISLRHNHLKHVDPNVFDHLTVLEVLAVTINPCLPPENSNIRNLVEILAEVKEKCKPRPDGSSEWKLNDDEEVQECENECGVSVFFNFLLLLFIAGSGCFLMAKKKKISLEGLRESVFYGRM